MAEVGYIAAVLKVNKSLITLNLGGNALCDEGIKNLADALKVNHSLKSLNVSSCGMTDIGLQHIAFSLMQNSALTKVELYNFQNQPNLNEFTESGIKHLTNCLRNNSTLLNLVLPADFDSFISDLQEAINEVRTLSEIATIGELV